MKISYVLATEKPRFCAETVLKSILDLPSHNKEIILVSSNTEFADNKEVKFVLDDKRSGGVHAYNKGYEHANGDWVVNVLDDNSLPENFLDTFKETESEDFKKLTIHVGQLIPQFWGPGHQTWHKTVSPQGYTNEPLYPLHEAIPIDDKYQIPYQSLNVPVILREDVFKYLDGVCWNTSFKHHYCDHWLGVYAEYINGCMSFWPKSVWIKQHCDFDRMQSFNHNDRYDIDVLNKLRNKLYSNGCKYNEEV
jgi:glycosyltransferase involved in cell wall biosynthesis